MDISRNNYESWFLDYLDGKLNAGQEEILMSFLDFNPDLKTELEECENLQLEAETSAYDMKASLRKPSGNPNVQDMLDDFEGYCVSSIEQQLSPQEEKILQNIIKKDHLRKSIYTLYESTRLKADKSILFPEKSRLKKRFINVPAVRITIGSAAATALLLIAASWFLRNNTGSHTGNQQVADITQESILEESIEVEVSNEIPLDPLIDYPSVASDPVMVSPPAALPVFSQANVQQADVNPDPTEREFISLARLEPRTVKGLEMTGGKKISGTAYRLRSERYFYASINAPVEPDNNGRAGVQREKKISLWRLADAGIQKINELAEDDYSLDRETNDEGKTRRLTFETPLFGISAPMRNTDNPQ